MDSLACAVHGGQQGCAVFVSSSMFFVHSGQHNLDVFASSPLCLVCAVSMAGLSLRVHCCACCVGGERGLAFFESSLLWLEHAGQQG